MLSRDRRKQLALRGLIAAAIFAVAVGAFWFLSPDMPSLLGRQPPETSQTDRDGTEAACSQAKLATIRDPDRRVAAQKRCADNADREEAKESRLDNARSAQAAEQSAIQSFYQARSAAFQSALGMLVLGASAWAAWAATRAARYAKEAADHTEAGAKEAKRSADTAEEALRDTRFAAVEQDERYAEQIVLAQETAQSAEASAQAMMRVAESMKINADQIVRSVDLQRDVVRAQRLYGQAQLRAYVSVLIGGALYQDRAAGLRFEAQPAIRNTGQTPARNLRWRMRAAILSAQIPHDFRFPIPAHGDGSALLPSGQTFETRSWVEEWEPDEEVAAIKRGLPRALCVWGYVIYEDIFQRTHRTTFAQQLFWQPSGPLDQNWIAPEIVRGIYMAKHNRAN